MSIKRHFKLLISVSFLLTILFNSSLYASAGPTLTLKFVLILFVIDLDIAKTHTHMYLSILHSMCPSYDVHLLECFSLLLDIKHYVLSFVGIKIKTN